MWIVSANLADYSTQIQLNYKNFSTVTTFIYAIGPELTFFNRLSSNMSPTFSITSWCCASTVNTPADAFLSCGSLILRYLGAQLLYKNPGVCLMEKDLVNHNNWHRLSKPASQSYILVLEVVVQVVSQASE